MSLILLSQIKLSLYIYIYICVWQDITYIMEIIFTRFSTINYLLKLTVEEFKHKITKRSSIDIAMWDVYHSFIRLVHYRFPNKWLQCCLFEQKYFSTMILHDRYHSDCRRREWLSICTCLSPESEFLPAQ